MNDRMRIEVTTAEYEFKIENLQNDIDEVHAEMKKLDSEWEQKYMSIESRYSLEQERQESHAGILEKEIATLQKEYSEFKVKQEERETRLVRDLEEAEDNYIQSKAELETLQERSNARTTESAAREQELRMSIANLEAEVEVCCTVA